MVRGTDRPAMTIAVDLGRKVTKQTNILLYSISAPDCRKAYVEKLKFLPGGCQINVGACKQIRCEASVYDSRQGTFCQPLMEERKFEC